ncbi:hypothetical protein [Rhizobium yanglingense]
MTGIHETAHADLDRIDIEDDQGPGGIAIVGMSGRFPGAPCRGSALGARP